MAKEVKFQLGDCSDVFVKKVRGGYEVRVCGEYEGNNYQEVDSTTVPEEDVWNKAQKDGYEEFSSSEIAARIGFYRMGFCESPLDC